MEHYVVSAAIARRVRMARNFQNATSRIYHYREIANELAETLLPKDREAFIRACGFEE